MTLISSGDRSLDLLHVATALHLAAKEFLTFDEKQGKLVLSAYQSLVYSILRGGVRGESVAVHLMNMPLTKTSIEGICPSPLPEYNATERLQSGSSRSMLHQRH